MPFVMPSLATFSAVSALAVALATACMGEHGFSEWVSCCLSGLEKAGTVLSFASL
jgi:hypothetical protein